MFWTVKQAARFLGLERHQVYYLVTMGEIESVRLGGAWRLAPESVEEYDKRFPKRKNRNSPCYYVYQGGGGFLFRTLFNDLPPDSPGQNAGLQRRRRPLVYTQDRPQTVLLKVLKPVEQLDLFTA